MRGSTTTWPWALALMAGVVGQAHALLVYGPDEADNLLAPSNGAPWEYVAQLDANNASGVYLGNGFVLTANHVVVPATARINGSLYPIDFSYAPLQIDGVDLKLLRILGDPGLAPLALLDAGRTGLNQASTLIGWGVGKGTVVANQGWSWGDDSTHAQRWGLNTTLSSYNVSNGQSYLLTTFERTKGTEEAASTLGDSGSALFQKYGSTWELAGITAGVETPGQSLYDHDTGTLFDQPDHSFFVPIGLHRDAIAAAIAVPEPGAGVLLGLSAVGLLASRRRRSAGLSL